MDKFFNETKDGIVTTIKVIPNSSKNAIEITEDGLKVRVTVIPDDNKANDAVIKLLSKTFKVPKSNIKILSGHKSRTKKLIFENQSLDIINNFQRKIG